MPNVPDVTAEAANTTLPSVSWEDLFLAAKLLGERYGVKVQVTVG